MRLTQRNKGIREPEMRLLAMIPFVLIMVLGNIVTAIGYQHSWSWKVSSPFLDFATPLQRSNIL
jgi:hypothetical protein